MNQLPRYPEYRASGLVWIGDIPSHWQTRRNRFLFREVDDRSLNGLETHLSMSQVHGLVPSQSLGRKSLQSENYIGGKLVAENDLVLNRLKAHLGVFARAKQTGVISPDYSVFRLKSDVSVPYCEALFKTPFYVAEFRRRTKGIVEGFWRLYTDDFYDVSALIPPRPEQDQMVAYLRAQDAQIARFIKTKRELIKLLNEQKQRIVASYLTGRSFNTEFQKDSGNLWLGRVPSSWVVCRVKAQLLINEGGCWGDDPIGNSGTTVLRSTEQAMDGSWKVNKPAIRLLSNREAEAKLLKSGDLVMTKSSGSERHIGKTSLVNEEIEAMGCCFSNFMQRLRPKPTLSSKWIWYLLNSRLGRDQMAFGSNSTTGLGNLTRDVIGNVWFSMPPKVVQDELIMKMEVELKPIDSTIAQERDLIKLVLDYRDRQIADVVTGQVDVRGWVPSLDDFVADEDLAVLAGKEEIDSDDEEDDNGDD